MNIGCVAYHKDKSTGSMGARWNLAFGSHTVFGTGRATGTPGSDYEGIYQIEYFDAAGASAGTYELRIRNEGGTFKLEWYEEGALRCNGIGMMLGETLIAGWHKTVTP